MLDKDENTLSTENQTALIGQIGKYKKIEENPAATLEDPTIARAKQNFYPKGKQKLSQGKNARETFISGVFAENSYKPQTLDLAERNRYIENNEAHKATISMESLLGKEGLKLFEAALKEERYSQEFLDAVVDASISTESGKLNKRLILPIGGPSGSGKSFAKNLLVKAAIEQIEIDQNETSSKINVAFIDGGIGREISQMRNFVISYAISLGYTGVSDIEEYTDKYLKTLKKDLFNAVKDEQDINLVIPETFSKPEIVDKLGVRKFMRDKTSDDKTVVICARIAESDPEATKHGGKKRCWLTDKSKTNISIGLGRTKEIPECKVYKAGNSVNPTANFDAGENNSIKVQTNHIERIKKRKNPYSASLTVINDLRLYKKIPETNDWKRVLEDQPGAIRVSKRVYKDWEKANKPLSLDEYAQRAQDPIEKQVLVLNQEQALVRKANKKQANFLREIITKEKISDINKLQELYPNLDLKSGDIVKKISNIYNVNSDHTNDLDENPLWIVLKAITPAKEGFSGIDKINAYAEAADAICDKRIGDKNRHQIIRIIQNKAWNVAKNDLAACERYKQIFGPDSFFEEYVKKQSPKNPTPISTDVIESTIKKLASKNAPHSSPQQDKFTEKCDNFKDKFQQTKNPGIKEIISEMDSLNQTGLTVEKKFERINKFMHKIANKQKNLHSKIKFFGQRRLTTSEEQKIYKEMSEKSFSLASSATFDTEQQSKNLNNNH